MFSFSVDVIDPCNRTGKVSIPMQHIDETRGVLDFKRNPAQRDNKDLSLCLLYQKGRCRAGSRCHQVHVDPTYIAEVRAKAAAGSPCCAAHGDIHSLGFQNSTQLVKVVGNDETKYYNLTAFGRTAAMDAFLRNAAGGIVHVSQNKICRLHSTGRCKFGKDCKNIHLCSRATPVSAPIADSLISQPVPLGVSTCATSVCGVSTESQSKQSSLSGSPIEKSLLAPEILRECGFVFQSVKEPSPMFDARGYELELSRLCEDLCESVLLPN